MILKDFVEGKEYILSNVPGLTTFTFETNSDKRVLFTAPEVRLKFLQPNLEFDGNYLTFEVLDGEHKGKTVDIMVSNVDRISESEKEN